jgi:hypothetical protein
MKTIFAQTEYDKGWKDYESGKEYLAGATNHWQQGWMAAQKLRQG